MDKILKDFKSYLIGQKLSKTSIKNYLSDVRRFTSWSAKNNYHSFESKVFVAYKTHLYTQKTPSKTINRYLSSLRKLGMFLQEEKITLKNPAADLTNIKTGQKTNQALKTPKANHEMLENFKLALLSQKRKPATIKNYVSDTNQFLNWLEKQKD
ncbi:site-specific integrase [Patescibacteria group bacterium]